MFFTINIPDNAPTMYNGRFFCVVNPAGFIMDRDVTLIKHNAVNHHCEGILMELNSFPAIKNKVA